MRVRAGHGQLREALLLPKLSASLGVEPVQQIVDQGFECSMLMIRETRTELSVPSDPRANKFRGASHKSNLYTADVEPRARFKFKRSCDVVNTVEFPHKFADIAPIRRGSGSSGGRTPRHSTPPSRYKKATPI